MLQLTDPADAAKAFAEVNFDWVKLGTGRFFVKRVVIDLDGCLLAYHHTSHPGRSGAKSPVPIGSSWLFLPRRRGRRTVGRLRPTCW